MNSSAQSQKALVIDNSSIITKIIKNFLIKSGFDKNNIFVAHDRNQAMMMFELEKFDIVTSGIHLKDSTGIDLLKEVREKNDDDQKKTPFLIISSEEKDIYQEKLDEFQGSDYLRKPFTHDQFQNMIGSMLNHTDQAAEVESPAPPAAPSTQWKESPVEVPLPIVSVFTESTIEAMEQYMAEAIPDDSNGSVELDGYFSAWVDLLDSDNRIQITLLINFPKNAACGIYEGIFGEVDIEQVGGVVQKLVNIIGGIVKPKILEFAKEIKQLVHEESELPANENEITWNLGLPESKMGENHSLDMKLNGAPKFHVPFKIKDETFHLVVLIQTY